MQVKLVCFFVLFCAVLLYSEPGACLQKLDEIGTPESPEALTMNLVNASTSAAHIQHPAAAKCFSMPM